MMEFYVFIAIKGAHKKRRRLEKVIAIIEGLQ